MAFRHNIAAKALSTSGPLYLKRTGVLIADLSNITVLGLDLSFCEYKEDSYAHTSVTGLHTSVPTRLEMRRSGINPWPHKVPNEAHLYERKDRHYDLNPSEQSRIFVTPLPH